MEGTLADVGRRGELTSDMTDARRGRRTARSAFGAWGSAALLWSALFAAVHLYWTAGGRRGLGRSADEADAALATGWFQLYKLSVAALAVGGAVHAGLLLRGGLTERTTGRIVLLARVASVVLLARGVLGFVLLIVEAVRGGRANLVQSACCSWNRGLCWAGSHSPAWGDSRGTTTT